MTKIEGETGIGIGTGIVTETGGTGIAKVGITVKEGNTGTVLMITEAVTVILKGMPVNMHLITLRKSCVVSAAVPLWLFNCILEMSD